MPCAHGGSCTDGTNAYFCTCGELWAGTNCATRKDVCASFPCQHSAACSDYAASAHLEYRCACGAGYSGFNCAKDIDECVSLPCRNDGLCRTTPQPLSYLYLYHA